MSSRRAKLSLDLCRLASGTGWLVARADQKFELRLAGGALIFVEWHKLARTIIDVGF